MERFAPGGNFPEKVMHLQWSSSTSRSCPTETYRYLSKNSRFQSHFAETKSKFRLKRTSLHEIFATREFRDFTMRVFPDTYLNNQEEFASKEIH